METVTLQLTPASAVRLARIKAIRLAEAMPVLDDEMLLSIALGMGIRADLRLLEQQQAWNGALSKEQAA